MQKRTIAEIKTILQQGTIEEALLQQLRHDTRKGVQNLLIQFDKRQQQIAALRNQYEQKKAFEQQFLQEGESFLAGVDEAGRGPLAGPVVAASVILPDDFILYGLTDSKQVSKENRNAYYDEIKTHAIAYHIAVIDEQIIDKVNIFEATKLAMEESLQALQPVPHVGLIDAVSLTNSPIRIEPIIKGDAKSISIAAASILAKVTRDRLMDEYDQAFPMYGFSSHKGYGTKEHIAAIQKYGPCKYHRKSFSPVQAALK